jgi:FMN-dependent NADH-azoreductase
MEKLLYVNACVRENSRTAQLATHVLERLNGHLTEVCLAKERIRPLDARWLAKRNELIAEENFNRPDFQYAKQFADAEEIVIAAPYWDLSFPAALKAYFVAVNVIGITFAYDGDGTIRHLCRAGRLIYVTTAGGSVGQNMGYEYIRALCGRFYGIPETICFKAEGLDVAGADVTAIMQKAEQEIDGKIPG